MVIFNFTRRAKNPLHNLNSAADLSFIYDATVRGNPAARRSL